MASIYSAEALAIFEALEMASRLDASDYTIFSDSRSALQALKGTDKLSGSYLIIMIKEKLRKLEARGKKVQFKWIPAHKGIKYNKVVDLAAKTAIRYGRDTQILIPGSDLKATWRTMMGDEFHEWWH
ncbi:uncharacterized protein [Venturia canescens]|uniref:uncharacterized protein n=1 Tax=Venturia canescens TaxID=32260 RepID=UPI001C9BF473|nr:uncharacterized protein LOC122409689 [Venturia canescens]